MFHWAFTAVFGFMTQTKWDTCQKKMLRAWPFLLTVVCFHWLLKYFSFWCKVVTIRLLPLRVVRILLLQCCKKIFLRHSLWYLVSICTPIDSTFSGTASYLKRCCVQCQQIHLNSSWIQRHDAILVFVELLPVVSVFLEDEAVEGRAWLNLTQFTRPGCSSDF